MYRIPVWYFILQTNKSFARSKPYLRYSVIRYGYLISRAQWRLGSAWQMVDCDVIESKLMYEIFSTLIHGMMMWKFFHLPGIQSYSDHSVVGIACRLAKCHYYWLAFQFNEKSAHMHIHELGCLFSRAIFTPNISPSSPAPTLYRARDHVVRRNSSKSNW